MNRCGIVISVWKENVSENEILSISQCLKILKSYQIIFVAPIYLCLDAYKNLCNQYGVDFKVERFEDCFFQNISFYNRLMLNVNFYKKFNNYEYILLYQPDAWIFEDDLQKWLDKGYDYIGAPWFEGWSNPDSNAILLPEAGNGGFSLRKVSSIIKILSFPHTMKYVRNWKDILDDFKKKRLISNILNIPNFIYKRYGFSNSVYSFFKSTPIHEDRVFAKYVPKFNRHFKVAPPSEAMYFSFEVNPSRLYEMTNKTLPLGCHAWEKYDPEFWSEFINKKDKVNN